MRSSPRAAASPTTDADAGAPGLGRVVLAAAVLGAILIVGLGVILAGDNADEPDVPADPPLPAQVERGMNLTAYGRDALGQPAAQNALRRVAALGTTHVTIPVLWFMRDARSSEIGPDPLETPSDASVIAAARQARALGLEVALAPHLNVRTGTFRGEIAPDDRAEWFRSYAFMLDRFAALATQAGARTLVIGSELTSMTRARDTKQWRVLIARTRERFRGRLTFAANWYEEAEQIGFWGDLDAVGVDAYFPLSRRDDNPPVDRMVEAWRPPIDTMRKLHERTGKPILLTEVGFTSRLGTAKEPHAAEPGPIANEPQRRAVEATFRALADQPWLAGTWWWEWSADGRASATDGGWSPMGKPAEAVLRRWFAAR